MNCPHCRKQIPDASVLCPLCGKELISAPVYTDPAYDARLRARQDAELERRLKPRREAEEQDAREKEEKRIRETLGLDSID